ncbi:hypothetical protein CIPAW_01G011900 [Carya illinoinensis]|uniref:Uncharacterized protein n=1 Tax=Carya illinoinensis TaxID=32201 RepID=A0A8T1RK10_CARIL|nr:hypothetical protein CIPAW_01G011900 [Carya illinoinensis]
MILKNYEIPASLTCVEDELSERVKWWQVASQFGQSCEDSIGLGISSPSGDDHA